MNHKENLLILAKKYGANPQQLAQLNRYFDILSDIKKYQYSASPEEADRFVNYANTDPYIKSADSLFQTFTPEKLGKDWPSWSKSFTTMAK